MKLIKLRTTKSTNSFLKELAKETIVDNFTVLVAEEQTYGRGQRQKKWISEPFKNLTFSVFVSFNNLPVAYKNYLNFVVSLTVFEVLDVMKLPKLTIKWPNDILSDNKKLCGILIENQFKKDKIMYSVVGIGLNVNQTNFKDLPKANSIKNILNKDIDLSLLLDKLITTLKEKVNLLLEGKYSQLENTYLQNLYRYQKPSMFRDKQNNLFMGKIIGVSFNGKLLLELENEIIKEFGIKEIVFV